MILQIVAALILVVTPPQYEITIYSEPMPMQESPYAAIWLNPGEVVQVSQHKVDEGEDWFYVHRRNYESGWLRFEYGKMKLTKVNSGERLVLAQ
jgi:hypothetical protein